MPATAPLICTLTGTSFPPCGALDPRGRPEWLYAKIAGLLRRQMTHER